MNLQKTRQKKTRQLLILILIATLLPLYGIGQSKTTEKEKSKIDYLKASNKIKEPWKLKGDKKTIFYHPYFLKLNSEEVRHLDPLKVKKEFAKLGITTSQNDRFVEAYTFFKIEFWGHKKSCENWESFKDLAPNSD